jgi:fructose-1,6-bisphosphatase/inositol monophosphatase family enzyme
MTGERVDDIRQLLQPVRTLHEMIRASVVEACERATSAELAAVVSEQEGDTIFALDRVSEELLIDFFEREVATLAPVLLIAEGLSDGQITLPRGTAQSDVVWRIIVDPIDGTRGLMYQKRSGWILTGVAPNRGPQTSLSDIQIAVQTEIPLVKQHLSDVLWAFRGEGFHAQRFNRLTGEHSELQLRPSTAIDIAHSYSQVVRFFPGVRDVLAAIDDEIVRESLGPPQPGKAQCFEDQYTSTGGQLYELIAGHDRFTADLRAHLGPVSDERGLPRLLCCHPYDLCTELIAREAGVLVMGIHGGALEAPLAVEPDVSWVGYANERIRATVEPLLHTALRERGLLDSGDRG